MSRVKANEANPNDCIVIASSSMRLAAYCVSIVATYYKLVKANKQLAKSILVFCQIWCELDGSHNGNKIPIFV